MTFIEEIDETKRAMTIGFFSILIASISSLFASGMDAISIATKVHVSAPLVGILKMLGFLSVAVIYWQLTPTLAESFPTLVEEKLGREVSTADSVDLAFATTWALVLAFAITLLFPVIPFPGYENPIPSHTVLQPFILALVGATSILLYEPDNDKGISKETLDFLALSQLLLENRSGMNKSECSSCGDEIPGEGSFYTRKQIKGHSEIEANKFCSALCVATDQLEKDET